MADRMDFNRNLSRYLSARKRWRPRASLPFSMRMPFRKVDVDEHGEAPKSSWTQRLSAWYGGSPAAEDSAMAENPPKPETYDDDFDDELEAEPTVEVSDVPEASRPGLFSRIGSWFSSTPEAPSEPEIQQVFVDELRSDLKVLASNFVGILEQMSHREREKIKQTDQFSSMKEVFRKHNIIK